MQIDAHTMHSHTTITLLSAQICLCNGAAICIVHLLMHIQEIYSLAEHKIFAVSRSERVCCQSLCMDGWMDGWMGCRKDVFLSSNKYVLLLLFGFELGRLLAAGNLMTL